MDCTTRERLMTEWKAAAALYAELSVAFVTEIDKKTTANAQDDTLTQLGQIADRLRLELERFKTHGCARETKAIIFRTT